MKKDGSALRKKVSQLEVRMMKEKAELAKLRKKIPLREVPDYVLTDSGGKKTKLSSLFGRKNELLLIHNMGVSCPYCTLWADGFNGVLPHLESRAAFAVESPDAPAAQKKFAGKRKWNFRMVSSKGTTFRNDMGFEYDGDPMPGVTAFLKDKRGRIFQGSSSFFGPGDNFCPTWDLVDLLPRGAAGWGPKFRY